MADVKFSQFGAAGSLTGSENLVGLQDGDNTKFPIEDLKNYFQEGISGLPYQSVHFNINGSGGASSSVLYNDFSGVTFSYSNPSNGVIRITPSDGSVFTSGKTFGICSSNGSGSNAYFVTVNTDLLPIFIDIETTKYDGTQSGTPNFSSQLVEIRVYP